MLYFAYGSNMSTSRLRARVPSAQCVGVAELAGHRLEFHKVGMDGSAKCDASGTGSDDDVVIGVVFRIDEREKPLLDEFEGLGRGYREKQVSVLARSEERLDAFTYCATWIDDSLRPFDWYRQHVLRGAAEHGLPDPYVRRIMAIGSVSDPDMARSATETAMYR